MEWCRDLAQRLAANRFKPPIIVQLYDSNDKLVREFRAP
jgi:hypothetical protein